MSKNGYGGLCSTCGGRGTCTFPHHEDRPRIFCEEFDWEWHRERELDAVARLMHRRPVAYPPAVEPRREPRRESRYRGLCATCDKQAECMFPKSGEGVWHCEEFV